MIVKINATKDSRMSEEPGDNLNGVPGRSPGKAPRRVHLHESSIFCPSIRRDKFSCASGAVPQLIIEINATKDYRIAEETGNNLKGSRGEAPERPPAGAQ